MIYGLVLVVHLFVCVVLIAVILLQGGRGGLSETLGGAAAQSLFGGGAASVLTKMTTYCAGVFVVTCLSLAVLSTARGQSVIERMPMVTPESLPSALVDSPAAVDTSSSQDRDSLRSPAMTVPARSPGPTPAAESAPTQPQSPQQ